MIWDLLEQGLPPGIVLTSGLWSGAPKIPLDGDLPRDLVSLILQAKRPQHLDHWKAGQDHRWRGPYFRFYMEEKQQAQLASLEAGVANRALVRYAAAAFLRMSTLYNYQRESAVAEHSTFVAPATLAGHRLWSYAGPGTSGYLNPEGMDAEGDTRETLLLRARESSARQPLREHVRQLAESVGADIGPADWTDLLIPLRSDLSEDQLQQRRLGIAAWAAFAQVVAEARAEWFVLDFTE